MDGAASLPGSILAEEFVAKHSNISDWTFLRKNERSDAYHSTGPCIRQNAIWMTGTGCSVTARGCCTYATAGLPRDEQFSTHAPSQIDSSSAFEDSRPCGLLVAFVTASMMNKAQSDFLSRQCFWPAKTLINRFMDNYTPPGAYILLKTWTWKFQFLDHKQAGKKCPQLGTTKANLVHFAFPNTPETVCPKFDHFVSIVFHSKPHNFPRISSFFLLSWVPFVFH